LAVCSRVEMFPSASETRDEMPLRDTVNSARSPLAVSSTFWVILVSSTVMDELSPCRSLATSRRICSAVLVIRE